MSAKSRIADAAAMGLVAGGVALSLHTGDWDWLARAGSALVVIGIVLTSSQIRDHMQRLRLLRSQLAAQSQRDWAADEQKRALIRTADDQASAWEIEGHGLYMLVAGTLIWGFGDLVGAMVG